MVELAADRVLARGSSGLVVITGTCHERTAYSNIGMHAAHGVICRVLRALQLLPVPRENLINGGVEEIFFLRR